LELSSGYIDLHHLHKYDHIEYFAFAGAVSPNSQPSFSDPKLVAGWDLTEDVNQNTQCDHIYANDADQYSLMIVPINSNEKGILTGYQSSGKFVLKNNEYYEIESDAETIFPLKRRFSKQKDPAVSTIPDPSTSITGRFTICEDSHYVGNDELNHLRFIAEKVTTYSISYKLIADLYDINGVKVNDNADLIIFANQPNHYMVYNKGVGSPSYISREEYSRIVIKKIIPLSLDGGSVDANTYQGNYYGGEVIIGDNIEDCSDLSTKLDYWS
jgi:hypothetical protein